MAYLGQPSRKLHEINQFDMSRMPNLSGDDLYTIIPGPPGPPGPEGPPGPPGLVGLPGFHSCECKTRAASADYTASVDDYYIGCISNRSICITLPTQPDRSVELVIKDELGKATSGKPIAIRTNDGSTIDGQLWCQINQPYGWVTVVWRQANWYIISN